MGNELQSLGEALEVIGSTSNLEDIEEAISVSDGIIDRVKDLLSKLKEEREMNILRIIEERGSFQIGTMKYVKGVKKSARQAKPIDILNALSDATEGDFEKIVGCLTSSAFKPGESKKVFKEADSNIDTKSLFWEEEKEGLKESTLKTINTAFLK